MPWPSGVISRMQVWFNIRNQLNIIHHINRQKAHNYLNRAGKAFNKIQHILMIKPVKKKKKTRNRRDLLTSNKGHLRKPCSWPHTQQCKLVKLPSKTRRKARRLLLRNTVPEGLPEQPARGNTDIQIRKGRRKTVYLQMTWLHIKNKKSPKQRKYYNQINKQ